jgi:hypothetical protein
MGELYWGEARQRWRRLEVKTTKPHGQEEARDEAELIRHRAVADLTGVGRGARQRLGIARGRIRVITDRERRE